MPDTLLSSVTAPMFDLNVWQVNDFAFAAHSLAQVIVFEVEKVLLIKAVDLSQAVLPCHQKASAQQFDLYC